MNKDSVMLVDLTVGRWSGRKFDRFVSEETNTSHNASSDASRVNKVLLPKGFFKVVNSAWNALQSVHKARTLPWGDDNSRILSAASYMDYMDAMRTAKNTYEEAADDFVEKYPGMIEHAREWLGSMFNEEDYPPPDVIRGKYYVDVYVHPLPQAQDFRVDLSDDEVKRIKENIEQRTQASIEEAMQDVWNRVFEVVKRFETTLSVPDKMFHTRMVTNAQHLAEVLPALNITGDPKLTKLQKEIATHLAAADVEGLRGDEAYRAKTAKKAATLCNRIEKAIA